MVTIFRNYELIDVASIAIWNRNKVVVTLAITVWGTSIAFHLRSKSLSLTASAEDLESYTNVVWPQMSLR